MAVVLDFLFDLLLVVLDDLHVSAVLRFLFSLKGGDGPPCGPPAGYQILISNGEKIPLLLPQDGFFLDLTRHIELHVLIALSLLSQPDHVDILIVGDVLHLKRYDCCIKV